ncbi:MAG: erythromycin esterase family protein [Agriterribacter sp.]
MIALSIKPTNYHVQTILTVCLILSTGLPAVGQDDIKKYISESSIVINAIEPDSVDYTDLTPIGDAIGNARIVMLGEQDHGDAPTFLAKTRLIKYLHEKKGFNVLAFESDFAILNYGWEQVDGSGIDSLIRKGIYALWTDCSSCQYLFKQYIPSQHKTASPLRIAGVDNQMNTSVIVNILDSVIRAENLPVALQPNYREEIIPQLKGKGLYGLETPEQNNNCKNYLLTIKQELFEKRTSNDFWVKVVDNMLSLYEIFSGQRRNYFIGLNLRDSQMAMNLQWITKVKYPDQKIIVWAHNYHVSKYSGHYPVKYFNEARSMGTVFTEMEGNEKDIYIIGFTSYEGTYGRLYPPSFHSIPPPKKNSFENWIPKEYQYAFVDFRKFNKLYPNRDHNFYMSGGIANNRYHQNYKAKWNKVFDGVFFIREMYPCKRIN